VRPEITAKQVVHVVRHDPEAHLADRAQRLALPTRVWVVRRSFHGAASPLVREVCLLSSALHCRRRLPLGVISVLRNWSPSA